MERTEPELSSALHSLNAASSPQASTAFSCHLSLCSGEFTPSSRICSTEPFEYAIKLQDNDLCFGCGGLIYDRFMLQTNGQTWHVDCLRCSTCALILEALPSCYVKDEAIFCKGCYLRQYGVKCARCGRCIQATDWVRRARQFVYHLACFACDTCKRQLSTGEEFALQDSSVLCKTHYMELLEGDSPKANAKQKSKRVRTTFADEQVAILQSHFQIDSNPDGQDLERIAQLTGLSKRVTQVWFQNSRARQKKYQGQRSNPKQPTNGAGGGGNQSKSSGDSRPGSECSSLSLAGQTSGLEFSPIGSPTGSRDHRRRHSSASTPLFSDDECGATSCMSGYEG